MDPRSKHNSAMHQFLTSGRGAVAVEFAFVLPIDGVPVIYTFANGARCGGIPGTLPLVSLLGDGGGALTPPSRSSNAGIRVLRVQSCMQRKEAPAYLTLVAPKEFQSRYTTLRKED